MRTVIYDANVLYPSTLRDVLIRLGQRRVVRARWTEQILDEVFRNLLTNRPDLDPERLARTRELMNRAIRDVLVTEYENFVDTLDLPDPDDRHVLAAAIKAGASVIVTQNLRDFPEAALAAHDVRAVHPDQFLQEIHAEQPDALPQVVEKIAKAWQGSDASVDDVAKSLEAQTPATAALIKSGMTGAG